MARKRPSINKREREFQKRQRELKKADRAAAKRERRAARDGEVAPPEDSGDDTPAAPEAPGEHAPRSAPGG